MRAPQSAAFIAAHARLQLLLEQIVPGDRHVELSRAISAFTAAAVRDDRARRAAQSADREATALFDELFGKNSSLFGRIFGEMATTDGGKR